VVEDTETLAETLERVTCRWCGPRGRRRGGGPRRGRGVRRGERLTAVPAEPGGRSGDRVRARLVSVAAEALGRMVPEQVPAPLRRLASFAPSRRARLGGDRILEAAEADESFRGRLAVQARAVVPEAGVELDAGGADSLDAAALAWLERPDGWQDVVTRAAESGRAREEEAAARAADERADRLQRRLDDVTDELKAARQKAREDLDSFRDRQRRPAAQAGGVPAPGEGRGRGRRRAAPYDGGGQCGRAHGAGRGRGRAPAAPCPDHRAGAAARGRAARASDGPGRCQPPGPAAAGLRGRRGHRAQARARPADRGRGTGRPGRRRRGRRRAPGVVGSVVRCRSTTRRCSTSSWRCRGCTCWSTATT
jgi:hypothetical protein